MFMLLALESWPIRLAAGVMLILTTTGIIATVLRKRSAAVVHAWWTAGFMTALCMPLLALVMPSLAIPIQTKYLPQPTVVSKTTSSWLGSTLNVDMPAREAQTTESTRANEAATGSTSISYESSSTMEFRSDVTEQNGSTSSATTRAPVALSRPRWFNSISGSSLIGAIWLVGVFVLAARSLNQWLRVQELVRNSRPLSDYCNSSDNELPWTDLLQTVCQALSLRSLRVHISSQAISPMVAGLWRPVVVLPVDACQWNAVTRKHVLLHEAAHIRRQDLLAQFIAQLVCMLHWYNPLAWIGAARIKFLRELAADDAVLNSSSLASDYASTLLDMARHYRLHSFACTVTMARPNTIAQRIVAILDASRNRAHLSKRAAVAITTFIAATGLTVSCIRLVAMAQEPSPPAKVAEPASAYKGYSVNEIRSMTVRVTDQQNQPVADATVQVSVWETDRKNSFPNRKLTTNQEGLATFDLPKRLELMRLWCDKSGYVPLFTNFEQGKHRQGELIPAEFAFQLEAGSKLSGRVVNPAGQPVEGATVQVRLLAPEAIWDANPPAIYSDWLAQGKDAVITDKDGRWSINNAPAQIPNDDHKFSLMIQHPAYAGDRSYGQLQKAQNITTSQLRDGSAIIQLNAGVMLSGKVTGPDGQGITDGLFVWSKDPYYAPGVNESSLGDAGAYTTPALESGEQTLTVIAPGFAPAQIIESFAAGRHTKDWQLERGHEVTIRFVDTAGQPIPRVSVTTRGWRNTEALFNHKHPNVPDSKIPRQADDAGIYHWSWAPADPVRYAFYAEGYASAEAELQAKATPHEIVLISRPMISGMVTDARTGLPVQNFRVVQLKEFIPDWYSTDYQDTAVGHDGRFRLEIDADRIEEERYRVKVEAPGYRTALGHITVDKSKPHATEDFQLEPAPALVGTVENVDGSPANQFKVCVGTATESGRFSFDRFDTLFGTVLDIEGSNRFELPATFEAMRLRVFSDNGFAEVYVEPNQNIGTIRLQPWPVITGHLRFGGKPVANENIYLRSLADRELTEARFQDEVNVQTDAEGNFRFPKALTGPIRVHSHVSAWRDSKLASSKSVPIVAKHGEAVDINLGGQGATLVGKIHATGRSDAELSKRWSITFLISRDHIVPYPRDAHPLSLPQTGPLEMSWTEHKQFGTWLSTHLFHSAKLSPEGDMRIESIEPGKYDLLVQLYEQPAECLVERIGAKIVPIEIAASATEPIDLGKIEVECRIGPRPGSRLNAIKVMDGSQRVRSVNDFAGRYVLLHAWQTTGNLSTSALPQLQRAIEKWPAEKFVAIGLNLDQDTQAAKALISDLRLNWAQNFLGRDSDIARQLALSRSPAYYFIDTEGKLISSSDQWSEIEKVIESKLK